jgi:nucleoside-diphosphate-sugar epimerase
MKLLLTGPCGRIGGLLLRRLLAAGHQVRCLDTRNDFVSHAPGFNEGLVTELRAEGLDFEWVWGDVRNPDDLRKALGDETEVVLHLAAATLPNHCEEHWRYPWDVNYFGTRHVIDAIRKSPREPKLVFPSSVAVYGITPPPRALLDEDAPLRACCTYGATKIASELEIQRSGIRHTILRLASSVTPSARHMMMLASSEELRRVLAEYLKLVSYESPMHLLSSHDTCTAMVSSLDNPDSDDRVFNVAGAEDCMITFGAYYEAIAGLSGRPGPPREAFGEGPYPQHYYDTQAARAALGLEPRGLEEIRAEFQQANAEFLELATRGRG